MDLKKYNIKLTIVILLIITTVLSTTYAFLNLTKSNNTEESTAGCFVVDYTGKIVSTNLGSIDTSTVASDYTKGSHATVTLNKDSNKECMIYTKATISLHTDTANTAPLNQPQALYYKVLSGETVISSGVITDTQNSSTSVPTNFSVDLVTVDLKPTIYIFG